MSPKSGSWIKQMAQQTGMIEPFVDHLASNETIAHGLSGHSYVIRASDEFLVFALGRQDVTIIDPKDFGDHMMTPFRGDICVIPPKSFVTVRSLEYLRIPDNAIAVIEGHEAYLQTGLLISKRSLQPGWSGYAKLTVVNLTSLPGRVYANHGIAHISFLECETG
jgi:dCTP deaminase